MAAKKGATQEPEAALSAVVAQIQKQYGEGAIVKLGESSTNKKIEAISTGAFNRRSGFRHRRSSSRTNC